MKPYQGKAFDIVVDLTLFSVENIVDGEWITQFIQVLPNEAADNLNNILIYNANFEFRKAVKRFQRLLSNQILKKLILN